MTIWTRKSIYHMAGPDGWSICRVNVCGVKSYELWETRGWNDSTCHGRFDSVDEAKQLFEQLLEGTDA